MTSTLAEKFSPPAREESSPARTPANKNARPQLMLHVCFRKGRQEALPYAYLLRGSMDEELSSFTLRYTFCRLKITGLRLQPLLDRLLDQTLAHVAEADSEFDEAAAADEPFIERIELIEKADAA